MRPPRIAVVGGGTAAACMVEAIAHHCGHVAGTLAVFDRTPHRWHGRVYQADHDAVLANVPSTFMSLRRHDPAHCTRWLATHESRHATVDDDERFPPRHVVGRYIDATIAETLAGLAGAGWRVELHDELVTRAAHEPDGVRLRTDRGREHLADQVVLCPGGSAAHDAYGLEGVGGYAQEPYPLSETLAAVPAAARVGVIGSGLTAVDVVAALAAKGHAGPIALLSRGGRLPGVRRRAPVPDAVHLTPANLERLAAGSGRIGLRELVDLIARELRAAGQDGRGVLEQLGRPEPALDRLRRQVRGEDDGWVATQVLQRAVVAVGQDAWYLLPEPDRAALLANHYRDILAGCCPMPRPNAELLVALADAGQLAVVSGLRAFLPGRGGRFCAVADQGDVPLDVLVNAVTPARHAVAPACRGLLAWLCADGVAAVHPLGGLRVDRATSRLLEPAGGVEPRVAALGDLTRGAFLFTTGIPMLVRRADEIAQAVETGLTSTRVS